MRAWALLYLLEEPSMPRPYRILGVFVLAAYLSGCGSNTPAPPTGTENTAAQAEAAKMPPPPGTKTK